MRIRIKLKKNDRFRNPRYWATMGTLAAYTAAAGGTSTLAAQQNGPPRRAQTSDQTLPVVPFQIPAGPLEAVTPLFERATGF